MLMQLTAMCEPGLRFNKQFLSGACGEAPAKYLQLWRPKEGTVGVAYIGTTSLKLTRLCGSTMAGLTAVACLPEFFSSMNVAAHTFAIGLALFRPESCRISGAHQRPDVSQCGPRR
jgi:hypothetical protein